MAEPKFTKGKCYVDFSQNPIEIVGPAKKYRRFGVDGERTLATVGDDCFYEDRPKLEREDRANAHLYAAAPELYEAADACLDYASLDDWLDSDRVGDKDAFGIRKADLLKLRATLAKARGETQRGK